MQLPSLFKQKSETNVERKRLAIRRNLLKREAAIGGALFGPLPKGGRREFFCLDKNTWIWHEEWTENGQKKILTTRYDVRPNAILKAQNGGGYHLLSPTETEHFAEAVRVYGNRVQKELYS